MKVKRKCLSILGSVFLITLFLSLPANATLIELDLVAGSGDKLLTFDTESGLEWLDLTATKGQSYNSIISGYGEYTTLLGFEVASLLQVQYLFTNNVKAPNDAFNIITLLGANEFNAPPDLMRTSGYYSQIDWDNPTLPMSYRITYSPYAPDVYGNSVWYDNRHIPNTTLDTNIWNQGTYLIRAATLSDFAIVGQESVFISSRGKVKGDKSVASNGTLTLLGYASIEGFTQSVDVAELASNAEILNKITTNSTLTTGQRSRIEDDVNAGGPVILGANTKVSGNVTSADAVTLSAYASVSGTITDFGTPESTAAVSLPTCTVNPAGTDDLTTPKNSGPHIVPTGSHKDYTYRSNNTVIFEGGDYSFETLFFGARTSIEFQGPTTIYILKELTFSNNVKQTLTGVNPEDVVYVLAPDIFATIGVRSVIFGTFCATGAEVILMNNVSLTGAAYAKTVKIGKYSTLITAPADLP